MIGVVAVDFSLAVTVTISLAIIIAISIAIIKVLSQFSLGHEMAVTWPIVFDRLTVEAGDFKEVKNNQLIQLSGEFDTTPVTVLLNSDASSNVIRPELAKNVTAIKTTQVERFDASLTKAKKIKQFK